MKKSGIGSNKKKSIVAVIGFLLCTLVLLYPLISDRWNQYRNKQIIDRYIDEVNTGDSQVFEDELKKAYEYNKSLYVEGKNVINEAEYTPEENYENLLNTTGTGIMCYIEIPKIDVVESVYHYSNDESLDKGVGHIHGSSLPVGGNNTHSVLTGHRGLPSQKIFTDLDKIENDKIKKELNHRIRNKKPCVKCKIYRGYVWWFSATTILTVYALPICRHAA